MIDGETDVEKLLILVHKRTRNKHGDEVLKASLMGVISPTDREMLRQSLEEMTLYEKQKETCEQAMNHNKALLANARKLLVIIWNVLSQKQQYRWAA